MAEKLASWDNCPVASGAGGGGAIVSGNDSMDKKTEDKLNRATKDSCKITTEVLHGIMSQVIKDRLFNHQSIKSNSVEMEQEKN